MRPTFLVTTNFPVTPGQLGTTECRPPVPPFTIGVGGQVGPVTDANGEGPRFAYRAFSDTHPGFVTSVSVDLQNLVHAAPNDVTFLLTHWDALHHRLCTGYIKRAFRRTTKLSIGPVGSGADYEYPGLPPWPSVAGYPDGFADGYSDFMGSPCWGCWFVWGFDIRALDEGTLANIVPTVNGVALPD